MKIVVMCTLIAAASYFFGYIVGRLIAELEYEQKRKEMGLDKEPEEE